MTSHEIKDFLRPDTHASQMILYWLESEGVSPKNIVDDGDWINFVVSVGQAERMLNTHFYYFFGGVSRNVRRIRALEYSVPARLRPYVHMIQPTTRFGKVRAEKSMILENKKAGNISLPAGYNATSCNYTITPDCIRGLYGFGSFTGDRLHGNRLGISGFVEEFVQDDDVAAFMNLFNGDVSLQDLKVAMVNGSRNVQNSSADSSEANLVSLSGQFLFCTISAANDYCIGRRICSLSCPEHTPHILLYARARSTAARSRRPRPSRRQQ